MAGEEDDLALVAAGWLLMGKRPEEAEPRREVFKPVKPSPWHPRPGPGLGHNASYLLETGSSYYLMEDGASTFLLE